MQNTGQPSRFQGREVFSDTRSSAPRSVPDATENELNEYRAHMDRLFRSRTLPAVIYKGVTYPARQLGEFIEPRG